MPDPFTTVELGRLMRLCAAFGFTLEEVYYGTQLVRGWFEGDPRRRERDNWPMVIRNAMSQGWALRGFKAWMARRGRWIYPDLDFPRDTNGCRRLTPELIGAVLEVQDARMAGKAT